jgi:cytochrome c553
MKRPILVSTLILLSAAVGAKSAESAETGNPEKGQSVAASCSACHGSNGNDTASMTTPKLAQQIQQYLVKQLHDFKSGARQSPIMGTMAAMLSDQDMLDVAAYFARQQSTAADIKDKPHVTEGEKIYKGGIAGSSIPACSGCHGDDSAGIMPAFPRLAGQHPQYIIAQLKTFRTGARVNDANNIMRDIAARLTENQIEAVAEYVGGLQAVR